jgi:hypothetical protein
MGFIVLAPYAGRPLVRHNDLRLYVFLSNIAHTGGSVWLRSTESPAALVRGVLLKRQKQKDAGDVFIAGS